MCFSCFVLLYFCYLLFCFCFFLFFCGNVVTCQRLFLCAVSMLYNWSETALLWLPVAKIPDFPSALGAPMGSPVWKFYMVPLFSVIQPKPLLLFLSYSGNFWPLLSWFPGSSFRDISMLFYFTLWFALSRCSYYYLLPLSSTVPPID